MQALTAHERSAIVRIAECLLPGVRNQLLEDLENASVMEVNSDRSRIVFDIAGYQRPEYRGQHPFGIEGVVTDRDGAQIDVLLHADENDRLFELELIRWGDGPVLGPDWESLELH